jgi:predicted aldo/keto reductase-like oxidoreductase
MSKINKNWSRRDFLKTAGTAAGMGGFLSVAGPATKTFGQTERPPAEGDVVPRRPFGKTGMSVPVLSLGGMFDIPSNQLLLKQSIKWGVTYWDTADCYGGGKSEEGIGQYFRKYPEDRKKVFLVSKSCARDPAGISELLSRSLERMNTSYIDLYFIHGISSIRELDEETKAWADKAKRQGKIRFFGFSTHRNMEECMMGASKLGWVDGIMMSYNYRLMHMDQMKKAVEGCVIAGIGLTAMKTQGGGQIQRDSESELKLAGRFLEKGFTDKQAKLKAVWENPHIASICSQMPNITILMANVAAGLDRTKLSSKDMGLLEQYARETNSDYCAGCAHFCETSVEEALPVAEVMRCLMYFRSYGERERARALYMELPHEVRSRLVHADYSKAEVRCPQGMPIAKLMREAANELG